jgi:predicted transcriptional regulator
MTGRAKAKYRSQMKILADMLEAIEADGGKALPTRIMFKANLSYDRLERHLSDLRQLGLVEEMEDGGKVVYGLTSKGVDYLVEFRRVVQFAKAFGIPL